MPLFRRPGGNLSALVAHTGWHWMIERFGTLRQFPWPAVSAGGAAAGMRWVMLLVAAAGLAWLVSLVMQRAAERRRQEALGVEK